MIIGLVRHGQTEWNALGRIQGQTDIPLNEQGMKQAEALAERLLKDGQQQWDAVVSSDLQRAYKTAEIIADKLGIPLLPPDVRLRERYFGEIEGTTEAERLERWGANWHTDEGVGRETDEAVRERGGDFLLQLPYGPADRVLVVTHGSFLAQLMAHMCAHLDNQHIGNMSYSIMEYKDEVWTPLLHNCTRHLPKIV